MPDSPKSRLGKYELLEEIGDGAEGRIFKARCVENGVPDVTVGELVALKRLRQTGSESQSQIFTRTSRILRALNHPNIVRYKDSFIGTDEALDEEVYCLVTELLEGQTLKELMDKNKTGLPWDHARSIIIETLQALEHAAKNGVVHRDLKPSNIYLTHSGDVKLIDFGIARHEDSGATTTSTGALLGSFDFMAPDFVLSQEASFRGDQQSDIFSFGVCLYQILTGTLPYPPLGGNAQIAYFQRYVNPDKLPKVKYSHSSFNVLRGMRACLEKCLTPNRELRYKTFADLLATVQQIQRRSIQHGDAEKYEYLEYIGKGGFGKVFRARRLSDGKEVAVKEVLADRNSSRFIREAKMLKMTQHPHLVQYLDFIEMSEQGMGEERRLFLILEYLPGMPESGLNYRIKMSPGGLDPVETLRVFESFLDCLDYLHQNTIIHRDIKPGNLYAPAQAPDRAKIFDLGIAHDTDGTKTHGQVPGTLDYMPAEFSKQGGERGSPQSDIYSMGVTLFQALTGKLPLPRLPDDEKTAWTTWYVRSEKPQEISYEYPVFSAHPELKELLHKALAFLPQDRFPSAKVMRNEIRAVLENWEQAIKKEAYEKHLTEARSELDKPNYEEAVRHARLALDSWSEGTEARQLLDRIEIERLRRTQYDTALSDAKTELDKNNVDAAARYVRLALAVWPEGAEAKQFLDGIETARQRRIQYEALVAAARKDLDRDDLAAATRQAKEALTLWPGGVEATQLLEKIEAEQQRKARYDEAIAAAQEALDKNELDDASSKAQMALEYRPDNTVARQLLDRIETERLRRIQYDTALIAAKAEFEKDNIDVATRHVRLALEVWPEGMEAREFLEQMESERQRRTQYESAMTAARRALELDNLDEAIQKTEQALQTRPDQAEAKEFLAKLLTDQDKITRYESTIASAREAIEREKLDEAAQKTQLALAIWPNKLEAKRLLERIETEKRRKAEFDTAIADSKRALEQKDFEQARSRIESALKVRGKDPAALELLALIEKSLREKAEEEPQTVVTFLDEPKTLATVVEPPVVEEAKTAAALVEPPSEKAGTGPGVATPVAPEVAPPPPEPIPVVEPPKAGPPPAPPAPPPPPKAGPAPASAPKPEPARQPIPLPVAPPIEPERRKKKSKTPVLLPIAACLVIGLGIVGWILFSKKPSAPQTAATPPAPAAPGMPAPMLVLRTPAPLKIQENESKIDLSFAVQNSSNPRITFSMDDGLAKVLSCPSSASGANATVSLARLGHVPFGGSGKLTVSVSGGSTQSYEVEVAPRPLALVLYGETTFTHDVNDRGFISIPCTARNIDGLAVASDNKKLLPDNKISFNPATTPNGRAEIRLQAMPGYAGEAKIFITNGNSGKDLLPVSYNLVLKTSGQPTPPRLETALALNLNQDKVYNITGQEGSDYFRPEELSLATVGMDRDLLAANPIQMQGGKFTMPVRTLKSGTARIELLLTAPNGTSVRKTIVATIEAPPAPAPLSRTWANSIGMTFAWVPALPGSTGAWTDRSGGGWVEQTEVTQDQFSRLLHSNPSTFHEAGRGNCPVETVSMNDAKRFCAELNRLEGASLPTGWRYAIPTEDQWEFFAKDTSATPEYAYFLKSDPEPKKPEAVKQLRANQFLLFDVLGNVAELTDTPWPDKPDHYVCRGGGYQSPTDTIQPRRADIFDPTYLQFIEPKPDVGFRVILIHP